jgi:hypothetical protein
LVAGAFGAMETQFPCNNNFNKNWFKDKEKINGEQGLD